MKKIVPIIIVIFLAACQRQECRISLTYNEIPLKYGQTYAIPIDKLNSFYHAEPVFTSSNENVVTVDEKGDAYGVAVGEADILVASGENCHIRCHVKVTPRYTTYTEPFTDWKLSAEEIKNLTRWELVTEDQHHMEFKVRDGASLLYYFENGQLRRASMKLNESNITTKMYDFLIERYQFEHRNETEKADYFINRNTRDKIKSYVTGDKFTVVDYTPADASPDKLF